MDTTTSNIRDTILLLVEIQDIYLQIFRLERKRNRIEKNFIKEQQEYEQDKKVYDEACKRADELKSQITDKQNNIDKYHTEIKDIREREKYIKTQKEFEALDNEQTFRKEHITVLDKEIKAHKKELIGIEEKINAETDIILEKEENYNEEKKMIDDKIKEITEKIKGIKEKVGELKTKIDPDLFEKFMFVLKAKKDQAVVPIVDNICGGCNITITPSLLNDVRKYEEFIYCRNCARILYIPMKK